MTDHNENKIIHEEDKDHPPEFEEMLDGAVSLVLVEKLCEDIEIKERDDVELVYDMSMKAISALGKLRKAEGFPKPKDFPRRQKILLNRLFRYNLLDDIPFPEVDTPYERFKAQLYSSPGIKFRVARVERRPRK